MPQVSDGPKGLNSILESAYSSAISQGKSKESASRIAWSAAKNKYKKQGEKWVTKMYSDLSVLVVALNKAVSKADAKDFEYMVYPIQKLADRLIKINEGNPIEYLTIDDLLVNPYHNPVDQDAIEKCKDEIKSSGKVKPIIYSFIDNDGINQRIVTDGYHRYIAMKQLGYKVIPARLSDERGTKTTELDEPVPVMVEHDKTEKVSKKDDSIENLPSDSFFLNPYHTPANRNIVEEKKQKIKETGKVKPLLYSEIDNNGKIERIIVDGYHRFIALKELGYNNIPVKRVDERGLKVSDALQHVPVKKEISSTPVDGLGLVRQDLQGKVRRPYRRINEDGMVIGKGGEGSGCTGPNCGRPSTGTTTAQPSDWLNSKTHQTALKSANDYVKSAGLPEVKQTEPVKTNPDNGRRIAEAYESMKSDPTDPKVKSAYSALGKEVDAQYKSLPVKVEFTNNDPYKTSEEMRNDIEQNNRLKVYTGGETHPLLGQKDSNGISLNDKFRAVHDYYGHAMWGHKFGPSGEENAWVEHSKMFSPEAQKALTTETRGQNSWFNFSKANEGKAPNERQFAEQKVGILPDEFLPKSNTTKFAKGGPGSGRHPESPTGRVDDLDSQIAGHKEDLKSGKINLKTFKTRTEPLYALKQRTGTFSGQTTGKVPVPFKEKVEKGGPGSGRHPEGKAFAEPFHSGNHVKQFLNDHNVVIGSVDKDTLSPEKNSLRQKEFESHLQSKDIPYKAGNGNFEGKPEKTYIISAPEKEHAEKLHDMLSRKYNQDSVIHVRNGHATLQHKDGSVAHANINNLKGGDLTSNYTEADGQRFQIPFKF